MRKYTLLLSVMVHVCAIVAVYLSPLLASDALPEPRTKVQWMSIVAAVLPPHVPHPPVQRSSNASSPPLKAPDGVQPEDERAPALPGMNEREGLEDGQAFFGIGVPGGAGQGDLEPPPTVVAPALPPPVTPVRPGGLIERPKKIVDVAPIYPPLAVQARQEGSVILEAGIAEDGAVRE